MHIFDQLRLEEILLRHDLNSWCLINSGPKTPAIVMGLSGKVSDLVNMEAAKRDNISVIRRFTGGGTVVVDHSSLWTTFIGRNDVLSHVKPYPREIMEWSADVIFGPAFDRWNREIQHQQHAPSDGSECAVGMVGVQ